MRLIDADALRVAVFGMCSEFDGVQMLIGQAPTIEARPVVRGEWLESVCLDDCFWVCSACKFPSEATAAPFLYKFCPNCGADMRGE